MYDINLLDETLIRNSTHQYHLSIQIGLNGLSFSILDLQKLKYIAFRNYPFNYIQNPQEISEYFNLCYKKDDLLNLKYKSISFMYIGENNTLVPGEFFDDNNYEAIFKLNHSLADNEIALYNQIAPSRIYSIYSIPKPLYTNVSDLFSNLQIYHHSTTFIRTLIQDSDKSTLPLFYVYLYKDYIDIGIASNNKLHFYNTFKYQNGSDIVYFVLSVLDQFKYSPKETEIFFSSGIDEHDEIFEFLNDYLSQIRFIRPSNKFTYSYLFDELHLTRFANLFNLALCEL